MIIVDSTIEELPTDVHPIPVPRVTLPPQAPGSGLVHRHQRAQTGRPFSRRALPYAIRARLSGATLDDLSAKAAAMYPPTDPADTDRDAITLWLICGLLGVACIAAAALLALLIGF